MIIFFSALFLVVVFVVLFSQFYHMLADIQIHCVRLEPTTIQCKTTKSIFGNVTNEEITTTKDPVKAEIQKTTIPKALHLKWLLKDGSAQEFAILHGRSYASSFKSEVTQLTAFSQNPRAPQLLIDIPSYGWVALLLILVALVFIPLSKRRRS
jgi:hypothetical protein